MHGYFPRTLPVTRGKLQKSKSYEKQMMSKDKYLHKFSRQMFTILSVYRNGFSLYIVFKILVQSDINVYQKPLSKSSSSSSQLDISFPLSEAKSNFCILHLRCLVHHLSDVKKEGAHKYLYVECVSHQAGVGSPSNPEQVVIALEPEAASVYCRERKMRDFVSESGSNEASVSDTIAHTDVKYVVVDIGGK